MDTQTAQILYAAHGFRAHADRRRSLAGRIWNSLRGVLSAWRRRQALRRAMLELNQLDNRMLRDIGIERSHIAHVVRHGRREREQRLSADRSWAGIWRDPDKRSQT